MRKTCFTKAFFSIFLAVALTASPLGAFAESKPDEALPFVAKSTESDDAKPTEAKPKPAKPSAAPLVDLLNSIELDPQSPQSKALDAYLDELLPTVVDDEMDTYEKVKACYDYLVLNTSYGSHMRGLPTKIGNTTCSQIYRKYGEVEGFGAVVLTTRKGMCNAYSAAFVLMVRKIGVSARLVEGETKRAGGGYTYHKWAEVTIGDTAYAFDPQLEQDLRRAGLPKYSVFCKTYAQIPGRYRKY